MRNITRKPLAFFIIVSIFLISGPTRGCCGELWLATTLSGNYVFEKIDPSSGAVVQTITNAEGTITSTAGGFDYGSGNLWLATTLNGDYVFEKIDPSSGAVVQTITNAEGTITSTAGGFAAGNGYLWLAATSGGNYVFEEINPSSGAVMQTITHAEGTLTSTAGGFAAGDGYLWLAGTSGGNYVFEKIDPSSGAVVQTVTHAEGTIISTAGGFAVGDGYLWLATTLNGNYVFEQIDPSSGAVVQTVTHAEGTIISTAGGFAYEEDAPVAPTATAATAVSSLGFTANWEASSGATGYDLDVSTSSGFGSYVAGYQNLNAGSATSQTVTGLSASTTYYYRTRASNAVGTSGDSGTISVTTSSSGTTNPPSGGNLVADGGFENGTNFSPWWSVSGEVADYPRIDDYPPYAHTGNDYADIGGSGANSISQTLSTTPGANYDVSIWLANLDDPSAWQVTFGTNILFSGNVPLEPYTLYETNVQAAGASTILTISYVSGTPSPLHVDDISVIETNASSEPPPTTTTNLYTGLAAYYQFEASGLDSSSNHLDLTLYGNPGFGPGLFGEGLELDHDESQDGQRPVDDSVFDFGVGDFTIQVWMNLNSFGSFEQTFIEKFEGQAGPGWTLTSPNHIQFYTSGAVILDGYPSVTTNVWHQVVVRRSGNAFSMLFDDALVASGTSTNAISATSNGLLIGKRNADDGRNLSVDGRLDEIAIWNRALSDTEIGSLYNGGQGTAITSSGTNGTTSQESSWIELPQTGGPPPARSGHVAVVNTNNGRMIIFGGSLADVDTATNDVWVFQDARSNSGNSWQQLSISGPMPSSRVEPAAAYDQANNRLILFGGDPVPGYCYGDLNDLWVLTNADGTGGSPGWMELSPTGTAPSPRSSTCSIYDPASNRLMVYGGQEQCVEPPYGDYWILTSANGLGGPPTWTNLSLSGAGPGPRDGHKIFYDAADNEMILFGGQMPTPGYPTNDTWVLSHANGLGGVPTWTLLNPAGGLPPARLFYGGYYDPVANTLAIFGGSTVNGNSNDVWILSNANGLTGSPVWIELKPTGPLPELRQEPSCVGVAGANRIVICDGYNSGVSSSDVWALQYAISGNGGETCDPPPSGLLHWWRAEGNAYDAAEGDNGTLVGGVEYTNGEVGEAFNFTGSNGYVEVPSSSDLNLTAGQGWTIEGWIRPVAADFMGIAHKGVQTGYTGGLPYWLLLFRGDEPQTAPNSYSLDFTVEDGVPRLVEVKSAGGAALGQWSHIALVASQMGGPARIYSFYINGVSVGTITDTDQSPVGSINNSDPLLIGTGMIGNGTFASFQGQIDELSIYNRALSPGEIQAIYNAVGAGKCLASIALTAFQEAGPMFSFGWNAIPGQIYQVQYKNNLLESDWFDFGAPITATNTSLILSDPLTNSERFYRVVILP